jgi:hypothetical protein
MAPKVPAAVSIGCCCGFALLPDLFGLEPGELVDEERLSREVAPPGERLALFLVEVPSHVLTLLLRVVLVVHGGCGVRPRDLGPHERGVANADHDF